jgi:acyl-CoA thioesterase-2
MLTAARDGHDDTHAAVIRSLSLLDLERIERARSGRQPETSLQRAFGGQVASQALVAAARTGGGLAVHPPRPFLRPGDLAS